MTVKKNMPVKTPILTVSIIIKTTFILDDYKKFFNYSKYFFLKNNKLMDVMNINDS